MRTFKKWKSGAMEIIVVMEIPAFFRVIFMMPDFGLEFFFTTQTFSFGEFFKKPFDCLTYGEAMFFLHFEL